MKEIKLTQGKVALVDDEYYDIANSYTWCAQKIGYVYYAARNSRTYNMFLHHFVVGFPLNNLVVDHIDKDGLNNQLSNLRIITRRQNASRNSTGCPGVSFHKGKFQLAVRHKGKSIYLGVYKTEVEAFIKYKQFIRSIGEELLPEHEELYRIRAEESNFDILNDRRL